MKDLGKNSPQDAKQRQITTMLVHYILLFPLAVGVVLIYVKKPSTFPMVENKNLLFVVLLFSSLFTFALARFIMARPNINPGSARMLALFQASLGECCAILALVFYLMTGDQNLPWVFMGLWLVHYWMTLRSLSTRLGG